MLKYKSFPIFQSSQDFKFNINPFAERYKHSVVQEKLTKDIKLRYGKIFHSLWKSRGKKKTEYENNHWNRRNPTLCSIWSPPVLRVYKCNL